MKKARAADAQLRALTRMHGITPQRVRGVKIACVQAFALCGSELRWDLKETARREDLQLLLNWHARSTLGALPTTPLGALMRDSGLTLGPVAVDWRQQQFTARLTNVCQCLKLMRTYNHPTSGAPICRVIKKEHGRGREAETMCWPNLDEELAIKTVILSADTAAK